jgi:hypothetical protein
MAPGILAALTKPDSCPPVKPRLSEVVGVSGGCQPQKKARKARKAKVTTAAMALYFMSRRKAL